MQVLLQLPKMNRDHYIILLFIKTHFPNNPNPLTHYNLMIFYICQRKKKGKYMREKLIDGLKQQAKSDGYIVQHYGCGNCYIGEISETYKKRNGKGKLYNSKTNLIVFDGQWKDDEKSGIGKCWRDDGTVMHGEWKENKREGFFLCTSSSGKQWLEKYEKDERIMLPHTLVCNKFGYVALCQESFYNMPTWYNHETALGIIENAKQSNHQKVQTFCQRIEKNKRGSGMLYAITSLC